MTRKEHVIEENFANIIAIFHIRRVTNLEEKCVFAVGTLGSSESLIDFVIESRAGKYEKRKAFSSNILYSWWECI